MAFRLDELADDSPGLLPVHTIHVYLSAAMQRPPDAQLLGFLEAYDRHISDLTLALREVILEEVIRQPPCEWCCPEFADHRVNRITGSCAESSSTSPQSAGAEQFPANAVHQRWFGRTHSRANSLRRR